jgi:hypothetical protein
MQRLQDRRQFTNHPHSLWGSPKDVHPRIPSETRIPANNRQSLRHRLHHEHSIERITMDKWKIDQPS